MICRRFQIAVSLIISIAAGIASLNNLAWVHIERASQAYEQAVARGDAAAIAALHTPGTVVMPPGMDAVRGRDA